MSVSTVTNSSGTVNYNLATAKRDTAAGLLTEEQLERLDRVDQDERNTERRANQELDKDSFLTLMMAQLQNQDPMEPMDNSQMIAQMAQFTSVEQLTNMATAMGENNNSNTQIISQLEDMTAEIKKSNDEIKKLNDEIKKLQGVKEVGGDADSEKESSTTESAETEAS